MKSKERGHKQSVLTEDEEEKKIKRLDDSVGEKRDAEIRRIKARGKKNRHSQAKGNTSWKREYSHILKNFYVGNHKLAAVNEIDICKCEPEKGDDCGLACLNRSTKIECIPGTCPCGENCTNNSFQKRNYAKLQVERADKKGWGLFAKQDIQRGQFVIEYVGEVLDSQELQKRILKYSKDTHYYFLQLNSQQTIDASRKGNHARFANHSCNPNCCTQKWDVNGLLCVGLFALRDISMGEEITFDYCFETYGINEMKCHCQASNCRGAIRAKESHKSEQQSHKVSNTRMIRLITNSSPRALNELCTYRKRGIMSYFEEHERSNVFLLRNLKRGYKARAEQYKEIEKEAFSLLKNPIDQIRFIELVGPCFDDRSRLVANYLKREKTRNGTHPRETTLRLKSVLSKVASRSFHQDYLSNSQPLIPKAGRSKTKQASSPKLKSGIKKRGRKRKITHHPSNNAGDHSRIDNSNLSAKEEMYQDSTKEGPQKRSRSNIS